MTMQDTNADEVAERGRQHVAAAEALLRQIEAAGAATRETVLEPLNDLALELANASTEVSLLSEVHPDIEVRTAAEAVERDIQELDTRLMQHRVLYELLGRIDEATLDVVARRMLRLTRQDMKREGVELAPAGQARVRTLRNELLQLEQEFARNIRDDVRGIVLADTSELEGLPPDYVSAHAAGSSGEIRITTDYPDILPFMAYARSERARKALLFENNNRAVPANLENLSRILEKRHELARLLGYPSWADYVTENKMSGSADAVRRFIQDALDAAKESGAAELRDLREQKHAEHPNAETIGEWELGYYAERVKQAKYDFDARSVRPYFEYTAVKAAVLQLNSELFELSFAPVADFQAWHPSVETYDVSLAGKPIGRMSLDMHPREGKFKHAACFTYRMGVGGKQQPHIVLVCNFPEPGAQPGPALLEHRDVVTFFHEFGHLVHALVRGEQPWVRLGPVSEWDFVEAPSQFLEEYIFDFDVLRRFARHVETGETISEALVHRLQAARDFGRGLAVQRQLFFSALSLQLHDRDPEGLDTTRLVFDLAREYAPFELLDGTHFQASFGHLQGYTALYYTYLWSLAISKDFLQAFNAGLLDTRQARRYRDLVLAPGGSKPAADLVESFLGRPSSLEAFRQWLAPKRSEPSAA